MERTHTPLVGSIALGLLLAAGAAFVLRMGQSDVDWCRGVLNALTKGKTSVSRQIDWEHLTALGVNVGATYRGLPNDQERAKYQQTFVQAFAAGFQHTGGDVNRFNHWRVLTHQGQQVVVAADYEGKQKVLLMAIPASGQKKLESLQWQ